MAIPIIITTTAITATRKEVGKQLAIKRPIPKDTSITPKPQFLRLLTFSPSLCCHFYYIQNQTYV